MLFDGASQVPIEIINFEKEKSTANKVILSFLLWLQLQLYLFVHF